jgi:hypothetical protein
VTAPATARHRGRSCGEGNRERYSAYRFEFCHDHSPVMSRRKRAAAANVPDIAAL